MRPSIEPPAFTELRDHLAAKGKGYGVPLRPKLTPYDIRRQERAYARSCILSTWIIAALLTAVIAWVLRQPPFALRPELIQVAAVTVNGLAWWLATTRIWFRREKRK